MNKFILGILVIALIGDMILNIRVIKSNKVRMETQKALFDMQKDISEKLDQNTKIHEARLEERKAYNRKIDTLNRKLTILNKSNYKKY